MPWALVIALCAFATAYAYPYEYARVITSQPIIDTVSLPVQQCTALPYTTKNPLAPLVGTITGSVIGNQFGKGKGNTAATVAGALIGWQAGQQWVEQQRHQTHCQTIFVQQAIVDGYRVTLEYQGKTFIQKMSWAPPAGFQMPVQMTFGW